MKTFKDIIKEATTEINQLPRRSKAFVDKHVVQKIDYPVDAEDQFTAKKLKKDKTKLASFHDGEDAAVYEEVDLNEGVSNLSDARLKFHVLKDIPHGSYTKKEMSAEHLRRKKTKGPAYNAVKPSLNEEIELDEISKDLKKSYLAKAKDDVADRKKTISQANKLKNASRRNFHSHSLWMDVAYRNQDKNDSRKAMMAKAKESMKVKKEEVDLDEAKTDVYHQHMLKALGKTRLPKDHGYTSSIANNGDFVVRKGGEVAGRIPKGEHNLKEASMTPTDMKQREDIVKGMKKSTQDFKDRYGSKWKSVMYATATKAAMKEESEQIDELSKNTLGSYVKKAADDMAGNAYAVGARDPLKPTAGFGKSFKRQKGIAKAVDKMTKEEVEQIDEISRDLARRYIRKVADKNNTGEASPKEVMKRSPGVVLAGKKAYGIGGKARVNATEEVEQIDELSSEKKMAYGKAAFADYHKQSKAKLGKILSGNKDTSGESRKIANRLKGISTSSKTEEVDLDEAFKAGAMKLNDGSSVTLTSESSNALNNLFNQLNSQNKSKMEQRLMSGSKGFNEILAFAKEV